MGPRPSGCQPDRLGQPMQHGAEVKRACPDSGGPGTAEPLRCRRFRRHSGEPGNRLSPEPVGAIIVESAMDAPCPWLQHPRPEPAGPSSPPLRKPPTASANGLDAGAWSGSTAPPMPTRRGSMSIENIPLPVALAPLGHCASPLVQDNPAVRRPKPAGAEDRNDGLGKRSRIPRLPPTQTGSGTFFLPGRPPPGQQELPVSCKSYGSPPSIGCQPGAILKNLPENRCKQQPRANTIRPFAPGGVDRIGEDILAAIYGDIAAMGALPEAASVQTCNRTDLAQSNKTDGDAGNHVQLSVIP